MGLKNDIYKAFEKNLGKDFVNANKESKQKVDDLAEDLRNAIIDFITAQTFRVDKLSMTHEGLKTVPILMPAKSTLPAAVGVPIFTPIPDRKISIFSMGVDKDGREGSNPVDSGKTQSDTSEVRLRESDITGR